MSLLNGCPGTQESVEMEWVISLLKYEYIPMNDPEPYLSSKNHKKYSEVDGLPIQPGLG